jgi:signal peptide peptidase SppA
MRREHPRILSLLCDRPWAITDSALDEILEIAQRESADLEAVAARLGRPLENAGGNLAESRGQVAILGIEGPLFRYANMFTSISGATSVEVLSQDLQAAVDNRQIRRIVLNVDSPGGQVDGINELADMIRAANQVKPVTAYIDGRAASAAYWLASAAGRIVANESAFLGSIGVVAAISDNRAAQERQGVKRYEIVSSQSPRKRPDPATEAGRAQILEQVDSLAQLFIERVAGFRGVSSDTVIERFGRGGVMPARQAIEAGMADSLGNFEGLIAELNGNTAVSVPVFQREGNMNNGTQQPDPNQAIAQPAAALPAPVPASPPITQSAAVPQPAAASHVDGAAGERARISAILTCTEATGREQLARMLAFETGQSPDEARRILAAAPVNAPPAPANPLAAAMERVPNPHITPGEGAQRDEVAAEAAAVLKYVPKRFLREAS